MPCSTGCPTQDHATWGECARAQVRFTPFWTQGSKAGNDWKKQSIVLKTDAEFNNEVCISVFGEEKMKQMN